MKLIMNTKSKSCELDPIVTTLLKSILPSVLPIITNIINQCNSNTINKKKHGMDLAKSSYRPRLVEKAILDQTNQYCNANNLLPDYQSAYREQRSCKTVLLKLSSDFSQWKERMLQ